MQVVRRRLSWLVVMWLFVQLVALVSAPIALKAMSVSADEAACDCPGAAPGQQCPMHRQHGSDHHEQQARCAMRSTLNQSNAALLVLATPGVVPQSRFAPHVPEHVDPLVTTLAFEPSRSELPEFPPPRA